MGKGKEEEVPMALLITPTVPRIQLFSHLTTHGKASPSRVTFSSQFPYDFPDFVPENPTAQGAPQPREN